MCLAIPARVISIDEAGVAQIELGGNSRETNLALVPEVVVGDYVLVHAGYAIQRLDEEEAKETLDLLTQIALANEDAGS